MMRQAGMKGDYVARGLEIRGIVQGVGFRPFVHRLAGQYGLKGEIANSSSGVSMHVEGYEPDIDSFSRDLADNPPPLARIIGISARPSGVKDLKDFSIMPSQRQEGLFTLIPPDAAVCDDCLRELFDPGDRRYLYPFINCTNCGPRHTIIDDIPYDRCNTSMKEFVMCEKCRSEYEDPCDRRFHAQPNACHDCGPRVFLCDSRGKEIYTEDPVKETVDLLIGGHIVAVKGLGGFHLAADAENDEAVSKLRERKQREGKPFALMSIDPDHAKRYAYVDQDEERLLRSPQRPIVLLKKRASHGLSPQVSPGNRYFGIMLPYTPLHYLILAGGFRALVMTSGNMSNEPMAIDNGDALIRLSDIADYFLMHDRDIYLRSDDSIVTRSSGDTMMVRRARGYVPVPVHLKRKSPDILACGAELKNTVCLVKDDRAFLSQHIGDLENRAAYDFFRQTIKHMKRTLGVRPEIIVCDLHPDYLSTAYGLEQEDAQVFRVQHHHAHIVSCMAENGIEGEVIGLAFDGTGYGPDNSIWGGEILIAGPGRYTRAASISPVPMPGGNSAVREPWKMAVSYLFDAFGEDLLDLDIPLFTEVPVRDVRVIFEMVSKGINSPPTSSLGRLFDGVAAITGIRYRVFNEAQAAMELEALADGAIHENYAYEWGAEDIYRVKTSPIIKGVVNDMLEGIDPTIISSRFHMTLIRMYSRLCGIIKRDTGIKDVALSGGVMQNSIFLKGLKQCLEHEGFNVYCHRLVPPNDGGISLGQVVAAAAMADMGRGDFILKRKIQPVRLCQ